MASPATLVALALVLGGSPARAGQDPGIRIGTYNGADADDPTAVIGVFGRFDVPGPLNLELSADYRQEKMLGGDLEATVIPVRATAILNLLPVVSPYLLAGVGIDYVDVGFHGDRAGTDGDSGTLFEFHAGAGLEVTLGMLSLIGDLRYCSVTPLANDAVRGALGHDYDPSGWYASLSAGISF